MIKQDPWIHIKDRRLLRWLISRHRPLDCIIPHLHTRAFVGSVALILGNFILARDLIGAKYDWHEV